MIDGAAVAAAVYEGLLGQRLGDLKKGLADLIKLAAREKVLTSREESILRVARGSRNLVHAGLFNEPIVTRTNAMDMRTVMDALIRKFANNTPQASGIAGSP